MERTPQAANVELLNIKIMIEETKGYTLSVDTYKKAKALKMKDPRYYIYASLRGSGMLSVTVGPSHSRARVSTGRNPSSKTR